MPVRIKSVARSTWLDSRVCRASTALQVSIAGSRRTLKKAEIVVYWLFFGFLQQLEPVFHKRMISAARPKTKRRACGERLAGGKKIAQPLQQFLICALILRLA